MQFTVYNTEGDATSKVKVHDSVFKISPNEDVIHRAVVSEMTNARQGTRSTKTRSEVRGGGRKPWRQKGRGVARTGSIRNPIWRGGGITFGPKPHVYQSRLPKKMKQLARRSVLSSRTSQKEIVVIDHISLDEPKTKAFLSILVKMGLEDKKVTFLPSEIDRNILLSARNLPNVLVIPAEKASTYDLLDCDILLFDKLGIKKIADQLAVS